MADIGLTHIALPVRSLATSIAFYGRYADMRVVHSRERVAWLSDETRPFVIVLLESTQTIAPLAAPAHLGVGLASRTDIDRKSQMARTEGCLIGEPKDSGPPVGYWALLRDPDGHTLELSYGQEVGLTIERAGA
jgi:catechol 2,3-dioxygenase-like lactoylglutathione lyase family enzyme